MASDTVTNLYDNTLMRTGLILQQTKFSPIGPLPSLKVIRSGDTLLITWPASVSGAALEMADSLPPTAGWVPVAVGSSHHR